MSYAPQQILEAKLSEMTIDTDKDWEGYGIINIKELALAMSHGDVIHRGKTNIENLGAGTSGEFLQTCGTGRNPQWWSY